jgi:hypothetical protein
MRPAKLSMLSNASSHSSSHEKQFSAALPQVAHVGCSMCL